MQADVREYCVALCTVPDRDAGLEVARFLVERRLAACVNLVPGLISVYRWEGSVQEEPELLLVVKTRAALFDELAAAITQVHPYDTPEIVALPIVAGAAPYLDWLLRSTGPAPGEPPA
jgi:periplasmic divalent cation tolerance protein